MCCLIPKHKPCIALLSLPFFNRSHTKQPQYHKLFTDTDMEAHQTAPEKVETEAGFTPSTELYGLFSSPGKAADGHEEQKVGEKRKYHLESRLIVRTPIRSKSSEDG
jgi:hypothetical protein